MADPQKIRLTFLWTDRAAVEMDFGRDYSKKLVDWASKFYKAYGFELDVSPKPGDREQAYAHVLAGSTDGYEPDMVTAEEYVRRYAEARRPTEEAIEQTDKELEKLTLDTLHKEWEIRDELLRFGSLLSVDWPAQVTKLAALFGELKAFHAQDEIIFLRWAELHRVLRQIDREFELESSFRDFDTPARLAIGEKVVRSVESRMRSRARGGGREDESEKISSESRLKVVFCRFRLSPAMQKPGKGVGPQPYGLTTGRIAANSANGEYMFAGPFTFINVARNERITLAHEMVHAAGREHIHDFDRIRSLGEIIQDLRSAYARKKLVLPTFIEHVQGGYYDGPADDIINYNSKGKDPDRVKLYPDDVKRMEEAFFVKTP